MFRVEADVEHIRYTRAVRDNKLFCNFCMKNGCVIIGEARLLIGGDVKNAEKIARQDALRKLFQIEMYLIAEKFYNRADYCIHGTVRAIE